jgi:hypothetical protein
MNRIYKTKAVIVGIVTAALSLVISGPAAFAENLAPSPGGSQPVTSHIAQSGMAGWTVAVIVVGTALMVALAVTALLRFRSSRSVGFAAS